LHDGLIQTLDTLKLKGIGHIILSASETNNLIEQVNYFGLTRYFDYVVGTDNVKGLGKIDAGLNLIKQLNLDPSHFIYVGDTIHDYEVSEALGVEIMLYSKGHQSEARLKQKTTNIIHHISDIINYIED
ncbi:MAG: HAD hydrolase-like protein, partial [Acholeplasmataceae bacterium]